MINISKIFLRIIFPTRPIREKKNIGPKTRSCIPPPLNLDRRGRSKSEGVLKASWIGGGGGVGGDLTLAFARYEDRSPC